MANAATATEKKNKYAPFKVDWDQVPQYNPHWP